MLFLYPQGGCSSNRHPHRQKLSKRTHQVTGAFAILCTAGAVVQAQDTAPPGIIAGFDITQRLEYSDNPDLDVDGDSDFYGRTVLGFRLDSDTGIDRFSLDLGTDIEEGRNDRSGIDATNSFATLGYDRGTRNARIGFELRYRETDVDGDNFDDFDENGNIINQTDGTRERYGFSLEGAVGQEAPVGASFGLRYDELTFSDTTDPDLTDESTTEFNGQIDFRITPTVTANLTALYRDFDAQGNGVNRETTGFGAGVVMEVTPTLTADLSLSYDEIERSGGETGTDDGLSIGAAFVRDLPNGTLGLNFFSDVTSNDNGRRSQLSVSRAMELPTGALSFELGVTGADTIGSDPLVNVDYRHDLPTGQITLGLSQRVVTDSDNNEDINTSLRAGYEYEINNVSGLGLNFSYFDRNELDENGNDGQRMEIGLTYRHDLTRDWGLVGGYSHTFSTEDNGEDRRRNTIFVGLQRSFNWVP